MVSPAQMPTPSRCSAVKLLRRCDLNGSRSRTSFAFAISLSRSTPSSSSSPGPNNAGKSSFVRLLEAFFSDPDGDVLAELLPRHSYYREGGPRTLSSIKVWFGNLTDEEVVRVGAAYRHDRTFWISLRWRRAGTRSFEASKVGREEARRLYEYVLEQYHFVKIPSVRVGGAGDAQELASLERLLDTLEAVLIRRTAGPAVLSSARSMMQRARWTPS
jgi:hypothetical protein